MPRSRGAVWTLDVAVKAHIAMGVAATFIADRDPIARAVARGGAITVVQPFVQVRPSLLLKGQAGVSVV